MKIIVFFPFFFVVVIVVMCLYVVCKVKKRGVDLLMSELLVELSILFIETQLIVILTLSFLLEYYYSFFPPQ